MSLSLSSLLTGVLLLSLCQYFSYGFLQIRNHYYYPAPESAAPVTPILLSAGNSHYPNKVFPARREILPLLRLTRTDKSSTMPSLISEETAAIHNLIKGAKSLYEKTFPSESVSSTNKDPLICAIAPGRVNLIGEHTDYTQGFVFPMAIEYSTVCVGKGCIKENASEGECQIVTSVGKPDGDSNSSSKDTIVTFTSGKNMSPLPRDHPDSWSNYVAGVVQEYMTDALLLPEGGSLSFELAIHGSVPLGSGLSSSAALEVAVATFIESIIQNTYSGENNQKNVNLGGPKEKALRCQRAENVFCSSPCGIMDQYVSSAASLGSALLIDCRSLEYDSVRMGEQVESNNDDDNNDDESPVFIICNSNVKHSIGGGEYPIRVQQCQEATKILRDIVGDGKIESLRDVTIDDVEMSRKKDSDEGDHNMSDLVYRRAKHVVTENERTLKAKKALESGNWIEFGALMNQSHESMKLDYEVSCDEIDFLVKAAQNFEGVYGSRLTGGGFGGCTVTLVDRSKAKALCDHLKKEYKASWDGKECLCFETSPGPGARAYIMD